MNKGKQMLFSKKDMDFVSSKTHSAVTEYCEQHKWPIEGCCLPYSVIGVEVLKGMGVRAVVQAGTACFRIVDHKDDNGVKNTYLSYLWSPDSELSRMALDNDEMPEMHVWIAIPDSNEVIDFTTRHIKRLCDRGDRFINLEWPEYVWFDADSIGDVMKEHGPNSIVLRPYEEAIALAMFMSSEWVDFYTTGQALNMIRSHIREGGSFCA